MQPRLFRAADEGVAQLEQGKSCLPHGEHRGLSASVADIAVGAGKVEVALQYLRHSGNVPYHHAN